MTKDKPNTNLRENSELAIELYEAYERLCNNPDYKKVIEYGFMELYALNQVGMIATPGNNGVKPDIYANLNGISVLQNFLITVERMGEYSINVQKEMQESELDSEE